MINKKAEAGIELFLLVVSLFAFSYIIHSSSVVGGSTLSTPGVCCEKTDGGAFCINTDEGSCDDNYKVSPTSCESTSYCKLGTCYDSYEGICMENTPQRVCEENNGTWDSRDVEDVPQCQLGCCVIADQAAFVPLVRCKRLSTLFGVEIDYRTDITDEVTCIAEANSQDVGACVYEQDFERVCEFTTRGECGASENVENVNGTDVEVGSEKKFYKDFLCSAEELGTSCARQTTTNCYKGDVYWFDSCGNRENVYSADLDRSWNNGRVLDAGAVCNANDGGEVDCGNCDYLLGTRCDAFEGLTGRPQYGDYVCEKTVCEDRNGEERKNGESWCVTDAETGSGNDPVGSRYFREICVDGEVIVEPCGDYRNEICLEGSIDSDVGEFGTAACRVNRWQDCAGQLDEEDCENQDKRDCMWLPSVIGLILGNSDGSGERFSNPNTNSFSGPNTNQTFSGVTGNAIFGGGDDEEEETEETPTNRPDGVCVPNFPPGLKFWEDGNAKGTCGLANAKCIVVFEEGLIGGEECVENCECLEENWALEANQVCTSLGDCGGYVNYKGVYTEDGYEWKDDGEKKKFTPNNVNKITIAGTGNVVAAWLVVLDWLLPGEIVVGDEKLYNVKFEGGGIDWDSIGESGINNLEKSDFEGGGIDWDSIGESGINNLEKSDSETPTPVGKDEKVAASSFLSRFFKVSGGGLADSALTGLQWAGIAAGVGYLVGSFAGFDSNNQAALAAGLGGGVFTWQFLSTWESAPAWASQWSLPIGIGVGAAIFIAMYKETDTREVTFTCQPWQAPTGGDNCEECNEENTDGLPCSEYRCKSLGQSCELVNQGTEEEACVYTNPRDTNPPIITPNKALLSEGYDYTNIKQNPPSPGFEIVNTEGECVKAFEPLEFGFNTDEPAQCKIDYNHTTSFDDMNYFVGKSNLYSYNHTEQIVLPNAQDFVNGSILLENGNEMNLFVRCKDKNGNTNEAEYAVQFCVDPSPDATAPEIKVTSIDNQQCIASSTDVANVEFYVNEPAECKWSHEDQSYEVMQNEMDCTTELYQINALQLFTCRANLTGIGRSLTDYYVRCKDNPGKDESDRNVNRQSYKFSLRSSNDLKIKSIEPNGTVYGATNPAPVNLKVQTLFGCNEGKAICYYSETGDEDDYIMFYDTDNDDGISTQRLDLSEGNKELFIKCVDSGGNIAINKTEFFVDIDVNAPVIARVYEESQMLKIVTVRQSECSFSYDNCDFTFSEGIEMPYANSTVHVAEWQKDKTYHIKCRDEFRNEGADCSLIVRPTENFLK